MQFCTRKDNSITIESIKKLLEIQLHEDAQKFPQIIDDPELERDVIDRQAQEFKDKEQEGFTVYVLEMSDSGLILSSNDGKGGIFQPDPA